MSAHSISEQPCVEDAVNGMSYEMVQMILNEQGPFFVVEQPKPGLWEVDPHIRVDNKINTERWKKLITTVWIILPTVRQVR